MFYDDLERAYNVLDNRSKSNYFEDSLVENCYDSKKRKKCSHMWPNGTDATYAIKSGRVKCPICNRIF